MKQIDPPIQIGDVLININGEIVVISSIYGTDDVGTYWVRRNLFNKESSLSLVRMIYHSPYWKHATQEDLQ